MGEQQQQLFSEADNIFEVTNGVRNVIRYRNALPRTRDIHFVGRFKE